MSLLLDALKKAAEQKEEKSEATITQTVNYYDKTSVMEDTHTEIDNTFTSDENRIKSEKKEGIVKDHTLTQFEHDATEVLVDDEGQYEDVTQIIELQQQGIKTAFYFIYRIYITTQAKSYPRHVLLTPVYFSPRSIMTPTSRAPVTAPGFPSSMRNQVTLNSSWTISAILEPSVSNNLKLLSSI